MSYISGKFYETLGKLLPDLDCGILGSATAKLFSNEVSINDSLAADIAETKYSPESTD